MKNLNSNFMKGILFTLMVASSLGISAQNVTVTGTVTDENKELLIGVTVQVQGTTTGTVTDVDGRFSLANVPPNARLEISYVGMQTQVIDVAGRTSINIILRQDTELLDEVVVVAYGTQKARSVTGAMSRINTDELVDMPVSNITQKMQGKFAGVQILNTNGEPNGNLSIRIRGQASINAGNNPLVVIDGFPTSSGLETLSPDEIESISILKDAASTTLYGSRAANGVILVTTKRGRQGRTNITFSANYGIETVSERGMPDVMNAQEFAQFKKEYYEDAQRYEGSTTPVPEQYSNPSAATQGTDWYKVLLRTAHSQNYNLGLQTGTDVVQSSLNLNYNSTEGTVINSYANRFSVRSNNEFKASDRILFGVNLSGSYQDRQVQGGIGHGRNIIGSSFLMDPALKYQNDDGTYPISYSPPGMFANANYYLVLRDRKNPRQTMRGTVNAYTQIELIEGLKYRLSANVDMGNYRQENWVPSHVAGGMFSAPPNPAYGSYSTYNYQTWLIENTLNYQKTFLDSHNIDFLVGYTAQKAQDISSNIAASDYPSDEIGFFNAAQTKVGSGGKSAWSMASWLSRLNYDYKDRYILSLSFRSDGSSRFGSNARWANFPSISAGWVISDENFMKKFDALTFLKLRASYGKVGNNNIGNYSSIPSVNNVSYVLGGAIVPGRQLGNIGNNDLTWETTTSWDIGLDLSLYNDRIFFMYDYYNKNTDGLLYQIDIPYSSGFGSIQSNIGEFQFWGHEFTLQTKNLVGDIKWSTDFNISFERNKAIKLGTNDTPIGGYNNQVDFNRTAVGMPLGMFFGYVYDGVYMTQEEYNSQPKHSTSTVGTVRMKDVNGDDVINVDDKTYIGNPNPDFIYGLTNSFNWNNFDASVVISGSVGNDIIDATYEWTENIDAVFNVRKEVADRWRSEDNPGKGVIPRTLTGTTELFRYTSDRWVFDGSYLMVKNITLGYTIPLKKNPYIRSARLYVSGQNLLTLTKYPGMNPEVSQGGAGGLTNYGVDHTSYPVSRVYTVGINVSF
jgi:TonB-linked outer membrane protein, SusC/RagA family/TonB-dependent outer membrane receptor, SusC/RagA subfamily, signature region